MINWINIEDHQPKSYTDIWVKTPSGKIWCGMCMLIFNKWLCFPKQNNYTVEVTEWLDCIPTEITPANPDCSL